MILRILVSAYACHPNGRSGLGYSEDMLGWTLVNQLGRFHQVWVLTASQSRAGIEEALQREPIPNIHFHYVALPTWLRHLRWFQGGLQFYDYIWQVKAYFVARRLHHQFHFHVTHHTTYANDWMASFIGALLPVPFIRGPSGGAHRTPKGFVREYSFSARLMERLRGMGQWVARHDPFFIMSQHHARAILVCNREAMAQIPQRWKYKAHLFPVNGVSSRDLTLTLSSSGHNETFQVLSVGQLYRIKGLSLAIKSFRTFVDRCPGAEFTIIGDGPELPRLQALVRQLELQEKVHMRPWMAHDEVLLAMAACDVFLFPSLRDGGGAVVVEAMAAGKPVICLDAGGPGFHVTDECGISVPPHCPEQAEREIAAALERLYRDKELRCQMGRAGRKRAEEVYHWDRLGERLQQIYEQALCIETPQLTREPSHL